MPQRPSSSNPPANALPALPPFEPSSQNIMATFDSNLTLHSQNLEASGDLAYDSGDFQESRCTNIATWR